MSDAVLQLRARRLDQVVMMLESLLDMAHPGAAERGRRLAGSALQLAERFEVPEQFVPDLALAARLHEIGMLAERSGCPEPASAAHDDWRYLVVSKSVLDHVEDLREAAQLIEAVRVNWDGSGYPGRLQQGQIPFRSRILHVLIDFYAELDRGTIARRPVDAAIVVGRLAARAGTWYDPVVISQLEATVSGGTDVDGAPPRIALPVNELAAGMILAEDLLTSSGMKLLARGHTITPGCLDVILQRHQSDPVVAGAWVQRWAAP
jgi:response regulator RpfG family c-di-GMP phosphodiesterase